MRNRLRDQLKRHPRLVAGSAVSAVVAVGVAVGLAIGVFGDAPPTADASPTPGASVSPSAAPSSTPPEPSASPPPGALLLQVSVDGLRMRTTASTSADIVRNLDRGEVVRVMSGPVETAGYAWYEVTDLDSQSGWVAMGDGGAPWLEAVPPEPTTNDLLFRFQRDCDVTPRSMSNLPIWPPDLTLTADGRVVLGWTSAVVRQLSPSGLAQLQRDVLDLPVLRTSADYVLERLPNIPDPPGHGVCFNAFWLGEGTAQVEVTAVAWLFQEEGVYWVPSPERRILDELAIHLLDLEAWLGPDAWTEPLGRPYVGSSYLFWLEPPIPLPPPAEVDAPAVTGAAWPFDGPIAQFGDPVGQARCGYLDLSQAFETVRLMREPGVPMSHFGETLRELSLDGFGAGSFATDAAWFNFLLTPRSADGYPSCLGES
jgi:hypothetical protein